MNKPRCGVADRLRPSSSNTRRKRFAIQGRDKQYYKQAKVLNKKLLILNFHSNIGSYWPKKKLTYKIKKYTTDMSPSDVDREIARAFQMWANVTDLTFVHVKNQSADVDIDIL